MLGSKIGDLYLFFKVIEADKEKICHHDISASLICITSILLPGIRMI